MRQTENIGLNILEDDDFVDDQTLNENAEKIDEVMKSLENPEYDVSEQTEVKELSSGESLKVALRKLAKAVADYISHKADKVAHITAMERTAWNAKIGTEKIAANLTTDTEGMVLAASMGKTLKEQIDTNASAISTLNSNLNNNILPNGRATFYSVNSWWNQLLTINDDVDNIKSCGMANTIDGWAHLPGSEISGLDGWGTLICFCAGTNTNDLIQFWYGMNAPGRLFMRHYRDRWSNWSEILRNQLTLDYKKNFDSETILDYMVKVNKNIFTLCKNIKLAGLYADWCLFTPWEDLGLTMDLTKTYSWMQVYEHDGSPNKKIQRDRLETYGTYGQLYIQPGLTKIGSTTFANLSNLTYIEIPNTVTSIGSYAFMGCSNAVISVPSSVTSIGTDAFNGVAHVYYSGSASGAPWGASAYN